MTRILILAASPKDHAQLQLQREVREIRAAIQASKYRDRFLIDSREAVRPKDLQQAILDVKPNILHFCGHGEGKAALTFGDARARHLYMAEHEGEPELAQQTCGLVLENDQGGPHIVSTRALAQLFELLAGSLECVVLNACYTEKQADAIARHVPFVVGMSDAVYDEAAVTFATAFYCALGAGCSFDLSYRLGVNMIDLYNLPDSLVPVLKLGRGSEAGTRFPSHSEVLNADPSTIQALTREQVEDLIESLERHLEAHPEAHSSLGLFYLRLARYREALRHFKLAIQQDPKKADLHYLSALAQIGGRRPSALSIREERAVENSLGTALQLDTNQAKYYYLLGLFRYDRRSEGRPVALRPPPEELFRIAQGKSWDSAEGERILAAVKVKDQTLLSILRNP